MNVALSVVNFNSSSIDQEGMLGIFQEDQFMDYLDHHIDDEKMILTTFKSDVLEMVPINVYSENTIKDEALLYTHGDLDYVESDVKSDLTLETKSLADDEFIANLKDIMHDDYHDIWSSDEASPINEADINTTDMKVTENLGKFNEVNNNAASSMPNKVISQFKEHITNNVFKDGEKIFFTLEPKELGTIGIEMDFSHKTVLVSTTNEEVSAILSADLSSLKNALDGIGLEGMTFNFDSHQHQEKHEKNKHEKIIVEDDLKKISSIHLLDILV